MTVGFVTHPLALEHEMPEGHPERSERIDAITTHLSSIGVLEDLAHHTPEPASFESLKLVHDAGQLEILQALDDAGGGRIDADTSLGPHSLAAARTGSQGAVDAATKVLDGEWSSAFVCMRPPGHHATAQRSMGFCLTNHVAVAARWAVSSGRASRVAILDWDAHHGNGSQDIFWTDPAVLYVSLHQYPWYPGTGDATERGDGDGVGTTINVPVPSGTAEEAFERALDELIEPAVAAFAPDLVFVSAGYDAHHLDPLCMLRLTGGAYHRMTRRVMQWGAGPVCVLEGGYDLDALSWGTAATIGALNGAAFPTGVPADELAATSGHPDADRWIDRAVAMQRALRPPRERF